MSQVALSIRNNSNRSKKTTSISGRVWGEKQEKNGVLGAYSDATSMAQSAPSSGPVRPFFAISRGGKRKTGCLFSAGLLRIARQLFQRARRQGLPIPRLAEKPLLFSATAPTMGAPRSDDPGACHESRGVFGNFAKKKEGQGKPFSDLPRKHGFSRQLCVSLGEWMFLAGAF